MKTQYGTWTVIERLPVRRLLLLCGECGGLSEFGYAHMEARYRHGQTVECRHAPIDQGTPFEDDARCRYVVACHPDGLMLHEIAELVGMTRQGVQQLEASVLRRLGSARVRELGWAA